MYINFYSILFELIIDILLLNVCARGYIQLIILGAIYVSGPKIFLGPPPPRRPFSPKFAENGLRGGGRGGGGARKRFPALRFIILGFIILGF